MKGTEPVLNQTTANRDAMRSQGRLFAKHPVLVITLLTSLVLLVHGYHPLADDGAVYVAGIKKLVHPDLYRPDTVFVLWNAHVSIFAHVLAALVKYVHIPLPILLLACHLTSIFLFLLGCRKVAMRVFASPCSQWGAVLLGAGCFTLPVAGTSLFIMDPYLTARSFSTPLNLFAVAAVLDGAWVEAGVWLLIAALLHPLMAGFAAIFLVALVLVERRMWRGLAVFGMLGLLTCAAIFMATRHVPLDLASSRAALSRSYFFLSSWERYEYPGLGAPLLLLLLAAWRTRGEGAAADLSITGAFVGSCALIASLCFVHRTGSLMLARFQVLRVFHLIYLVGTLLLGGLLGRLAQRRLGIAACVYLAVLLVMFAGQRLTYPASDPIEWPSLRPRNHWQQAFLWISANTPKNAVFALDSDYIESSGEDAQGFRATAERSALADWYKDGGIAAMFPAAQEIWWRQVQATQNLNRATDAERVARLVPLGASWIVLPEKANTSLLCPYHNAAVKVCSLAPHYQHL